MVAPARLPLVLRYIEMNPVRAGIVPTPQLYPYSSAQQRFRPPCYNFSGKSAL